MHTGRDNKTWTKGKVLWRESERTTPPVVYKEWLPIQSTSWYPEMSLQPTSWWTEQDGLIEEAFHWRFAYSFRRIGHEHHDSRHEAERYTKWHTAHRESQTETDMGFRKFRDSVPPTIPHLLQISPPLLQQGYTSSIQGHSSLSFQNWSTPRWLITQIHKSVQVILIQTTTATFSESREWNMKKKVRQKNGRWWGAEFLETVEGGRCFPDSRDYSAQWTIAVHLETV